MGMMVQGPLTGSVRARVLALFRLVSTGRPEAKFAQEPLAVFAQNKLSKAIGVVTAVGSGDDAESLDDRIIQ